MAETLDFSMFAETRGQQGEGNSLEVKLTANQDFCWKSKKKLRN